MRMEGATTDAHALAAAKELPAGAHARPGADIVIAGE
jgi:hypothetical protein